MPTSLSLHSDSSVSIIATSKMHGTVQYGHAGIYLARDNTLAESTMSCVCRPHLPGACEDSVEMEIVEMRRIPEPKKRYLLAWQELWLIHEDIGGLWENRIMLINKTSNLK